MTDTTAPAELAVPTAARTEFAEHHRLPPPNSSAVDWDEVDRDLRAFSRPIVAAELRRFADQIADDAARIKRFLPSNGGTYSAMDRADLGRVIQGEDDARMLRARADELDPQL